MTEVLTFQERKRHYLESVKESHNSPEKNWWQYPGPSFYSTDEYANQFPEPIDISETMILKPQKQQLLIGISVVIVSAVLLFIIGEQHFGFGQLVLLAVILLIVLPFLLDNRPKMMISRDGIWLHKEKLLLWKDLVATYIKETNGEKPAYSFIAHYYNEGDDEFKKAEMELSDLASPAVLASAIERFRESGNQHQTIVIDKTKPL